VKQEGLADLKKLFGDSYSTRLSVREEAGSDESGMAESLPDAVISVETTEDVLLLVDRCRKYRLPLTVRGGGTSLSGNPIPVRGGVVADCTQMAKIVSVDTQDRLCTVQPGVVYDDLAHRLAEDGLCLPTAPGAASSSATIGGMVANNASGLYAVKYGSMRRRVLGLTAVTGLGEVIRTGHRCRKSSAGYDLTALLVGSEGTLAVITEVTLALEGLPAHSQKLAFSFNGISDCAAAAAQLMQRGIDVAACELLDAACIGALNSFKSYGLPDQPALFLEVHGATPAVIADTVEATAATCREHGGAALPVAGDPWAVRHWLERAISEQHPNTLPLWFDVSFPISELANVIERADQLAARDNLNLYTYGQAGLGVLYILIRERPDEPTKWEEATDLQEHITQYVVDHGGSCTAQSGVGMGNRPFMKREHGIAVEVMRRVKTAFDPDGILNPGKVLP